MDLETKIILLERLVKLAVGLFFVGLAVIQPVPISTIWVLVLAVVGLGTIADSLHNYDADSERS